MDNNLKIIRWLGKNLNKAYTMHELSKLTKIPYATFYRTVSRMNDILNTEQIGHSKTIKLNIKNTVAKPYLTIASDEEKKEYLKQQPVIKKIANELKTEDIVILFGSYANRKQTEKSDIDLLIINSKGKRTISFAKYELLFKIKINPIFVTEKEFRLMLADENENVGKQALKNHIILNNPEQFWKGVLNAVYQGRLQKGI